MNLARRLLTRIRLRRAWALLRRLERLVEKHMGDR